MNPLEFNTAPRTPAYKEFSGLLLGVMNKTSETSGYLSYYTPPDESAVYMMTRYMTDVELEFINHYRAQAGYHKNGQPLKPIPRLAYLGGDNFQVVTNQRERKAIESRHFGEGTTHPQLNQVERKAGVIRGNRL
jgi:hypothetical protein